MSDAGPAAAAARASTRASLSFEQLDFGYEPCPIGLARNVFSKNFHCYVKSKTFILQVMEMLYRLDIDLGIGGKHQAAREKTSSFTEKFKHWVRSRGLSCRWEF